MHVSHKIALMALSVVLTACASSTSSGDKTAAWVNPESPLGATLQLAFKPPTGIKLTPQQIDAYPYAGELIRIGDNPQALIALAQQAGGQAHYATSEGYLVSFQQGRLIATDGLATDARFLDAQNLPNPARAVDASAPVCWRSSWRATGAQRAGYFLLKGCLQPAKQGNAATQTAEATPISETTTVREIVTSPLTGHRYTNHYTLDADLRVIASRQQLGPLLPVWQTTTVKHPSRALESQQLAQQSAAIAPTAWQPGPVALTVRGLQTLTTYTQPSLLAVTQPLLADTRIDWANSALYCTEDAPATRTITVAELKAQQAAFVADTRRLVRYWRADGAVAHAMAATELADDVASWSLGRRVVLPAHPARLPFAPKLNLALRCPAYTLDLAANDNTIALMGLTHAKQFNLAAASPLKRFARVALWRAGASQGRLLRVSPNGEHEVFLLNPHTREPTTALPDVLLQAGDRLLVPWQQSALPPAFADLNARLLSLVPHRLVEPHHAP